VARTYQLWVDREPGTGRITACGMRPLTERDEPRPGRSPWDRIVRSEPSGFAHGGPWALLLRLLNMERQIQPEGWPFDAGEGFLEWPKANEGFLEPDWAAWKSFGEEFGVPYFLTSDHGRPVLWFPATDGEWYGFMFHFGMQPGGWNWWVAGQPLRYEPAPGGGTLVIMVEKHEPRPTLLSLDELLKGLPPGLFDVDAQDRLTLREALDMELQRHGAEERDRCRFVVYHPLSAAHGGFGGGQPFAVQTLEKVRTMICELSWLWLSPLAGLWPAMERADIAIEVNGDPNVDKKETADKLAALKPRQKYAMTCLGTAQWPRAGMDPLDHLLQRVRTQHAPTSAGAKPIVSSLVQQARDEFWRTGDTERAREARRRETHQAWQRLTHAARMREYHVTSDIFAAAALQLEWAVQAELTLLACPHPGCGLAFFREPGYHGRFCPAHREDAARQARSRVRRARGEGATGGPPPA